MSPKAPLQFKRPTQSAPELEAKFKAIEERAEARGNAVAGQPLETVTSAPAKGASESKLRRGARGVRIAGYVTPELEAALRMLCARERRSTSDALTEAVQALIERHSDAGTES